MEPLFLVEQCYNRLPASMKEKPWEVTEHGRKVLQNEDELNAYVAAYGEMHIVKCKAALQNFPFENFDVYPYEIFDWGCGQGLATLTLLNMLQERGKLLRLKRIYLIEPSEFALKRAETWVKQFVGPGIDVVSVNAFIPNERDAIMPEVTCSSKISINLFSNILDIRSLNLSWLAFKTASLANTNYMICIGSKFVQNTNTRISDFCGYFMPSDYFSCINSFPYSYTSRTHHAYGCETRCFIHHREDSLNSYYQECSINDINTDPYDYESEVLTGLVDEKIYKFYNNLRQACGNSYDVFYKPSINCDTVDFVLASKENGILLINICESLEKLDEAFNRVVMVKSNIFDSHLRTIKIDSIMYSSVYNCVKTGLFFPNNNLIEINQRITELNEIKNSDSKEQSGDKVWRDFYKYLLRFCLSSNLKDDMEKISSRGFKYEYYEELLSLMFSKWHSYKDGDLEFHLSDRQKEIVRSRNNRIRIKGVAGCGKTQVVANRAVEQHLKTGDRVLIITFNISLIQYIKMRINQVPADFSPNMFEITNYHQFFKSKANQYVSKGFISLADYDNPHFFNQHKGRIQKYKSIIIDEVQDFKESWLQSIISNFLADDGSVSLFGDGEQNIYNREYEEESKMPPIHGCGFSGRWNTMSERISMRILNPQIASLSSSFADTFLDNPSPLGIQDTFMFEEYYIRYWKIDDKTSAETLASNIRWIMSEFKLEAKDVVVLGQSINLLRDLEAAYVKDRDLHTMINFETASQYAEVKKNCSPSYIHRNLEEIRRAAKTHFTTACNDIKMSTIHSFKGWESKSIILILQPEMQSDESFEGYKIQERENTPALIYTALTRAKCNLFILNLNNPTYHSFFKRIYQ